MTGKNLNIHRFNHLAQDIVLPQRFTFPFNYKPHPLSVLACEQLIDLIESKRDWNHDFGLGEHISEQALGKMFGVLVVKDSDDNLGFLAAFSGKIGDTANVEGFVPPIYNRLEEEGFFKQEEEEINKINRSVEKALAANDFLELYEKLDSKKSEVEKYLAALRAEMKVAKERRALKRESLASFEDEDLKYKLLSELDKESQDQQRFYKRKSKELKAETELIQNELEAKKIEIESLKTERRNRSNALQERLFDEYQFLNFRLETKDLRDIFRDTVFVYPPAGAGDCAAPKLLQYAFRNNLRPLCMAEFWWGISPPQEVRKHRFYYPACRGKCEPILGHMLKGIEMDTDPMDNDGSNTQLVEIIYEDDFLAVVNKPAELLSVDGKKEKNSLIRILRKMFPYADGPLLVHRLDMSTSGLMLVAKMEHIYKVLQQEFIHRRVQKRYEALLDGHVSEKSGIIELPLRVDLENRPRQLVCFEHGKHAITKWELINFEGDYSRVYFYPVTGRTHQLRVHAAHVKGLNLPIVGDDLYGKPGKRLHLHAGKLEFNHPVSGEKLKLELKAEF